MRHGQGPWRFSCYAEYCIIRCTSSCQYTHSSAQYPLRQYSPSSALCQRLLRFSTRLHRRRVAPKRWHAILIDGSCACKVAARAAVSLGRCQPEQAGSQGGCQADQAAACSSSEGKPVTAVARPEIGLIIHSARSNHSRAFGFWAWLTYARPIMLRGERREGSGVGGWKGGWRGGWGWGRRGLYGRHLNGPVE